MGLSRAQVLMIPLSSGGVLPERSAIGPRGFAAVLSFGRHLTGFATPIAYASCTSRLGRHPAATMFFASTGHVGSGAVHLARGSLPLKRPARESAAEPPYCRQ